MPIRHRCRQRPYTHRCRQGPYGRRNVVGFGLFRIRLFDYSTGDYVLVNAVQASVTIALMVEYCTVVPGIRCSTPARIVVRDTPVAL